MPGARTTAAASSLVCSVPPNGTAAPLEALPPTRTRPVSGARSVDHVLRRPYREAVAPQSLAACLTAFATRTASASSLTGIDVDRISDVITPGVTKFAEE